MRIVLFYIVAVIILLASSMAGRAQFMVVEVDRPYLSSEVSAIVVAPNNEPMPGATVKRMRSGWKKLIESTKTDWRGRFRFRKGKSNLNYLEITRPGFQVMHVKLKVVRRRIKTPRISVEIAT